MRGFGFKLLCREDVSLQQRYVPIAVTVAVLLVGALIGYVMPTADAAAPARVVLDNSGGRVIFTHAVHADDYGYECADCHHDGVEDENATPISCGSCHPKSFDEEYAKNHQKMFPSEEYCLRCHDEDPASGVTEDTRPDKDMMLTRADAFHGQCMDCHKAEDAGPYDEDSCYTCHAK